LEFPSQFFVVFSQELQLEVGNLVGDMFCCFDEFDLWQAYLVDEAFSVVLNVAFHEAVTMSTLGMAVGFRESEGHVLAVDVMSAVGLLDW
jgi:hypothetical protein